MLKISTLTIIKSETRKFIYKSITSNIEAKKPDLEFTKNHKIEIFDNNYNEKVFI